MKWLCERSLYGKQQVQVEANTREEALHKIRIGDYIEDTTDDFDPVIHMVRIIRKIKE
jgi:multidrug resistance efflux pump